MQGPLAARELVSLAVFSESKQIRQIAIGFLKQRERREYVELLISLIQFPIKYRFQPVTGPGTQGGLLIETPRFVMLRTLRRRCRSPWMVVSQARSCSTAMACRFPSLASI